MKERIRIGKELLEAKRIEEENERKRSGLANKFTVAHLCFVLSAVGYKKILFLLQGVGLEKSRERGREKG